MTSCYLLDVDSGHYPAILCGELGLLPLRELAVMPAAYDDSLHPAPWLPGDVVQGALKTRCPEYIGIFRFTGGSWGMEDWVSNQHPIPYDLVIPVGTFESVMDDCVFECCVEAIRDHPLFLLHELVNPVRRENHVWLNWRAIVVRNWRICDHQFQSMKIYAGLDQLYINLATKQFLSRGEEPVAIVHCPTRKEGFHSWAIHGQVVEAVTTLEPLPSEHLFHEALPPMRLVTTRRMTAL